MLNNYFLQNILVSGKLFFFNPDRLSKDKHDKVPLFLFGDFNFRLDAQGVIQVNKKFPLLFITNYFIKVFEVFKILFGFCKISELELCRSLRKYLLLLKQITSLQARIYFMFCIFCYLPVNFLRTTQKYEEVVSGCKWL